MLYDSNYSGEPLAQITQGMKDILGEQVSVLIVKRSQLHSFKVMPKRWLKRWPTRWIVDKRLCLTGKE